MRMMTPHAQCAGRSVNGRKVLLTTTALIAAGSVMLSSPAIAKDVGDFDVWEFQNTAASERGEGYVEYKADKIIDNLVQEDIGKLGHVHLDSRLTVATGVESGPMTILGKLTSTGEVLVLDTDGFLFGNGSVVDTAGFAAIGGSMDTQDLLDGKTIANINVSEGASIVIEKGAVVNVAEAGLAAFVAPYVTNNGVINAKMGRVTMAAGDKVTLDLYGDRLVEIAVDGKLEDALIEQAGTINAEGGRVMITAQAAKEAVDNIINMSGVINASSATMEGGKIVLGGGDEGTVRVSGKMDVSGADKAGEIEVTGQHIDIADTAELAADGGDGNVIMIGEESLAYHGATSADGGFVETSAPHVVIDGTFKVGESGEVLIDPVDLCVFGAGGACGSVSSVDFITSIRPTLMSGGTVTTTNADGAGDGDVVIVGDLSHGGFTTTARGTWNVTANDDLLFGDDGSNATGMSSQAAVLIVDGKGLNVNFTTTAGPGYAPPSYVWFEDGSTLVTGGGDVGVQTNRVYIGAGTHINAAGGDINIDNAAYFRSVDADSLLTSGTGTISLNQKAGGSIQNAINAIENTGSGLNTISVGAGTYAGDVVVSENNFVLNGANAGVAGEDPARGPESVLRPVTTGFYITGERTVVDGFKVVDADTGISVNAHNATVSNNIIDGAAQYGIAVKNASNVAVRSNNINDAADDAIHIEDSFAAYVHNNAIYRAGGDGVDVGGSAFAYIDGNFISDVVDNAIAVLDSLNPFIYDNDIRFVGLNGIDVRDSLYAQMSYNDIYGSSGTAIWLDGEQQGDIFFNTINGTGRDGIHVEDNYAVDIWGNNINNVGDGQIKDGGNGIVVNDSDGAEIWDNIVDNAYDDGIELYASSDSEIRTNTITYAGGNGIEAGESDYVYIGGNTIEFADENGINVQGNDYVDIDNNTIRYIGEDGILVEDFYMADIHENNIYYVGEDGIRLRDGSGYIAIHGNQIEIVGLDVSGFIRDRGDDEGADGIHVSDIYDDDDYGSIEIIENIIRDVADDGIVVAEAETGLLIAGNTVDRSGFGEAGTYGSDAIRVLDSGDVSYYSVDPYSVLETPYDQNFGIYILGNDIFYTGDDGIEVIGSGSTMISGNTILGTGYYAGGDMYGADGIHVRDSGYVLPVKRIARGDGLDGLEGPVPEAFPVYDNEWNLVISDNEIHETADDGVQAFLTGDTIIAENDIYDTGYFDQPGVLGADGIHVIGDFGMGGLLGGYESSSVEILGNVVINAADDGIQALAIEDLTIDGNEVLNSGDDGISILGLAGYYNEVRGEEGLDDGQVLLTAKKGLLPYPYYDWPTFDARVTNNIVETSGGDGIQSEGFDTLLVGGNDVSFSYENGLYVSGFNNGEVIVDGNTFVENDIGAHFESGLINLIGDEGNEFIGGRVGLRFAPYPFHEPVLVSLDPNNDFRAMVSDEQQLYQMINSNIFSVPFEGYAPLALIDNDGVNGYGGTIGTQYFEGQSDYFVELANGAFYAPGNPTQLDGLDSTYVTSLGTITPVNVGGVLDTAQYNVMETMFYHYPDQEDLGLFSFGAVPQVNGVGGIDQQERIFNAFGSFVPLSRDVRVTLAGIPTIPDAAPAAQDLANISPAAGGEDEQEEGQKQKQPLTAEQLNELEAASGGTENVSCWGDAMSTAGGGKVVSYSFGSSLGEKALSAAATCGSVASAQ